MYYYTLSTTTFNLGEATFFPDMFYQTWSSLWSAQDEERKRLSTMKGADNYANELQSFSHTVFGAIRCNLWLKTNISESANILKMGEDRQAI